MLFWGRASRWNKLAHIVKAGVETRKRAGRSKWEETKLTFIVQLPSHASSHLIPLSRLHLLLPSPE